MRLPRYPVPSTPEQTAIAKAALERALEIASVQQAGKLFRALLGPEWKALENKHGHALVNTREEMRFEGDGWLACWAKIVEYYGPCALDEMADRVQAKARKGGRRARAH
jgi:hypothetical protein